MAESEDQIIRYAALLRGTESAWQALSYGLTSVTIMGEVGAIYINFGLWAIAILPVWLLVRHFGTEQEHYGQDGEPHTEVESEQVDSLGGGSESPSEERVEN